MKNTIIIILLLAFGLSHSCKNDVYQWRGAKRDGMYQESGLLNEWPEEGPELLWVSKGLGRGYAAPVVTEDQIFVNGEEEGNSFLQAFDLNGKPLWKSPNGKEFLGEGFFSVGILLIADFLLHGFYIQVFHYGYQLLLFGGRLHLIIQGVSKLM